jgi:hypothetical protein
LQPISSIDNAGVLRELYDFGLGRMASVSTCIGGNRFLVFTEAVDHHDQAQVDWGRMTAEMFAAGELVEAQ